MNAGPTEAPTKSSREANGKLLSRSEMEMAPQASLPPGAAEIIAGRVQEGAKRGLTPAPPIQAPPVSGAPPRRLSAGKEEPMSAAGSIAPPIAVTRSLPPPSIDDDPGSLAAKLKIKQSSQQMPNGMTAAGIGANAASILQQLSNGGSNATASQLGVPTAGTKESRISSRLISAKGLMAQVCASSDGETRARPASAEMAQEAVTPATSSQAKPSQDVPATSSQAKPMQTEPHPPPGPPPQRRSSNRDRGSHDKTEVCSVCANIFLADSNYCRKCGAKRPEGKQQLKRDRASVGKIAEDRWIRLLVELNVATSSTSKASDEDIYRCANLAMAVEDALEELFLCATQAQLDVVELGKLIRDDLVKRRASTHELKRSTHPAVHTRGMSTYAFKHIHGSPSQLYDLMGEVGAGAFGTVRKATHLKTGEEHAVKCVPKAKVDSSTLWEEIEIIKLLDHPHVMRVYNTFEDDKHVYMVLELCTGGPFFDTLFRLGILPEAVAAMLFRQIMNVLSYIHSRNVCHRDIKPENFLVLKKGDVRDAHLKLIDFGSSKRFDLAPMTTKICTPQYVAPEILMKGNNAYTEKVDVWSCGVMLYLMLSGRLPFHKENEIEMLKLVRRGIWDFKPDKLWSGISEIAKGLIKSCLCPVDERCCAGEALRSEWLHTETSLALRRLSLEKIEQVQKYISETRLKRVALRIIARQIDDESISALRSIFLGLDVDSTGTLAPDEIREAVGQLGVSEMKQAGMVELMCQLDPTGSGMIEYTEFLAATMTPDQYCQEEVCRAAFCRLDADMDGILTRKDLEKLLSEPDGRRDAGLAEATLGELFSELDAMIEQADEDLSGGVSFKEFMQLMQTECIIGGESAASKRKQRGRDYSLKEFMDVLSDEELSCEDVSEPGDDDS